MWSKILFHENSWAGILNVKDFVNIYCQSKLSCKENHETLCVLQVDFIFRGGGEKIWGCIDW